MSESNTTPEWIDRHSVTCLLCGGLADERRTVNVREQNIDPGLAVAWEEPLRFVAKCRIHEEVGFGEAHSECFDYALEHGVYTALDELEPKTHR